MYYYFDKSTKRKSGLADYCEFCDIEFRRVLKHVSTRWLSLELTIHRTLQQYPALRSYFLSEGTLTLSNVIKMFVYFSYILHLIINIHTCIDESIARFERLKKLFSDPLTEVYLMFYEAALQCFIGFNKFLQREDPIISVILSQMNNFIKKLLGRFVTVTAIRAADGDLSGLHYEDSENQLPGKDRY